MRQGKEHAMHVSGPNGSSQNSGGLNSESLMSIRDFAQVVGVNQSVLRYYEKIGVLEPAYKPDNNYRFYSSQQIIIFNFIKVLTSAGFSLKDVAEMARDRAPNAMMGKLLGHMREVDREMNRLREAYTLMHIYADFIYQGINAQDRELGIYPMKERHFKMGPLNDFSKGPDFYDAFVTYCKQVQEQGVNLAYPIGGWWPDFQSFCMAPGTPTRFFSVDPTGPDARAEGNYLTGYAQGFYGDAKHLADLMSAYGQEHRLKLKGPVYHIYLLDEISQSDPENYLVQSSVQVV